MPPAHPLPNRPSSPAAPYPYPFYCGGICHAAGQLLCAALILHDTCPAEGKLLGAIRHMLGR